MLDLVLKYCIEYIKKYESTVVIQPQKYTVLYAMVQCACYIFCFRWRELDLRRYDTMISFIASSRFTPLRFICGSVASEFAMLCHSLQILYLYPFLKGAKEVGGLDYFPFDPCGLELVEAQLEDSFVVYQGFEGFEVDVDVEVEEDDE